MESNGLAQVLSPGVKAGRGERRCGDSMGRLWEKVGLVLGFPICETLLERLYAELEVSEEGGGG